MSPPRKNIALPRDEFPGRLQRLREERRLSKSDLAGHSGLTYRTIHDLEQGRRDRVQERTLHAIAEALDVSLADLLGSEPSVANSDAPKHTRRPLMSRRSSLVTLAILLVVLAVAAGNLWNFAQRHAHWEIEEYRLTLKDAVIHTEIWMLESKSRIMFCEISPWNDEHLLVGLGSQTSDGGRLLCLERATGDTLWTMAPDIDEVVAAFGEEIVLAAGFSCNHLTPIDWDGDGTTELVVHFVHGLYYPAVVCVIDAEGRRLGQYANKGHLYGWLVVDLDRDGSEEFLVTGTNNAKDYQGATAILLDREHWRGASIDSLCSPQSQVPDSARIRLVLPQYPAEYMAQSGVTRLEGANPQIHQSQDESALISLGIGTQTDSHFIIYLDGQLRPIGCEIVDFFARVVRDEWPAGLKEGTGPGDTVWRAQWLADHRRFEAGHWPPAGD